MLYRKTISTLILGACFLALWPNALAAQQAPPAEGDEAALVAVLESDAPLFDKAKACQQLAVVGTRQCVPALAALLSDEELSHYARIGLEPIPDPAVDEALRAALDELDGRPLVGLIGSIGMRRDAKAVDALAPLLAGSDADVAAAAAWALGRIATPEAVGLLQKSLAASGEEEAAVADACLTAAQSLLNQGQAKESAAICDAMLAVDLPGHIEIAALYGTLRAQGLQGLPLLTECLRSEEKSRFRVALRMAQELPDEEITRLLVDELPKLAVPEAAYPRQALVLRVLANRGDKAALPAVLAIATDGPAHARLPALAALARLGDASAVPVLLKTAVEEQGELAMAARDSLVALPGSEVDARLEKLLAESKGQELSAVVDLVGRGKIASAVPVLLRLADDDDAELRAAALDALGVTVGPDAFPALIDKLVKAKNPDAVATVKSAFAKACLRAPDRDACASQLIDSMDEASVEATGDLLDLLGVVGGDKALEGVAAMAEHESEAVQDAATRVLGEWITADAAPVLLKLATEGSEKFKVRTLRGYIRIPRQLDVPGPERIAMCRKALAVAERDEERKLVLETLARYPSKASLAVVVPFLDDPGLKSAAALAAVTISDELIKTDPKTVAEAMPKAVEAAGDAELEERAKTLQRKAAARMRR